ncbi:MAG TPA: insulinase family protein, partial [candidate division Zixibacteria bacterium]|nr:insulinase family protein [candidate division Zixibacteria bacterium]
MKFVRLIIQTVLALTALQCAVFAQDPRTLTAPELNVDPPKVERFSLENGLNIVFLEAHELPVVRMTFFFPGGSAYEADEVCGVGAITAA